MTCFQNADDRFATWHYRRDPTHVVFYREETFAWLAAHFGWEHGAVHEASSGSAAAAAAAAAAAIGDYDLLEPERRPALALLCI